KAWPPQTLMILAHKIARRVEGQTFVDWAVAAMQADFDSPSLRILAGLDLTRPVDTDEAVDYFQRSLGELGLVIPPQAILLRDYLAVVARRMVNNDIGVREALDEVHSSIVTPLDHPGDLMSWCFLWEGNHSDGRLPDDYGDLTDTELGREALELARAYLTLHHY
ncbi:MAG: hypothetical protein WAN65_13435, partial [Candidatus Sulfotelmatobacter sp.]